MLKNMLKWKRLLYIICFTCIMLIDWSRGGARWVYWATFINLTGVVMAVLLASHFSWKNQPWKKYALWGLVWFIGSGVGYLIWQRNPGDVFLSQYITAAISLLGLGIIALRIWLDREKLQHAGMGHPYVVALWVVVSVLMVCSRFGEIWQLFYLLMFGMFYLLPFSKEEKEDLWVSVADGCIVGFFIIQIWAYGFRPYDVVRYSGAYSNCNMNALFYLVTYIMVLYRLHYLWHKEEHGEAERQASVMRKGVPVVKGNALVWGKVFLVVLAAGLCSFMLFTMGRTAILVAAAVTVVYGIFEFCVFRKLGFGKILVKCCVYVLCIAFTFPCVYLTIRYLPTILHHPVWWEGEYDISKVHSFDPYDSEKYISMDEVLEAMLGRFWIAEKKEVATQGSGVQDSAYSEVAASFDLFASSGKITLPKNYATIVAVQSSSVENQLSTMGSQMLTVDESELLTGEAAGNSMAIRFEIYKKYLQNLNLTGHELEEGYMPITETFHAWHAQNVFIQVLFYYGIPAGILFIILMAVLGIQALRLAIRNRKVEDFLVLLVWLVFVGYGMMECVWYMGQSILFLMYLVPKLIIDSRSDIQQSSNRKS